MELNGFAAKSTVVPARHVRHNIGFESEICGMLFTSVVQFLSDLTFHVIKNYMNKILLVKEVRTRVIISEKRTSTKQILSEVKKNKQLEI